MTKFLARLRKAFNRLSLHGYVTATVMASACCEVNL